MAIASDEWLARVLERPVYKVAGPLEEGELARAGRGFFYAKVDVRDVERVRALTRAGFFVVDVNVTFAHEARAARVEAPADVLVSRAGSGDEAVLAIAGSCFRFSRFHLDPDFDRALADRVKREWVASYLAGRRGERLLVARRAGRPVGFLAVLATPGAWVIDLVGVATEEQSRGAGRALVAAFFEEGRRAGAATFRVGTQVANVPSLRFYERAGFRVESSQYVLHRHAREGDPC